MLVIVNILYTPDKMWFIYPLIGWSIGLLAHYLYDVRWIEQSLEEDFAKAEYLARKNKAEQQ